MITQENQEWIKNALISENITQEEHSWLLLLEKVISMRG
jgi:hypothetical protein